MITLMSFNTVNGKYCCNSVPETALTTVSSFNTVNGKYCCNLESNGYDGGVEVCFNTVNGKYCCNFH